MGRSQVKYRATHGRGRGRGAGSSRGRGNAHASATGGRSLGSNAFRYQEREEDGEDDTTASVESLSATASGRRQFFADEKNYRPSMGAATGTYFQSQTVRQWEAAAADDGTAFGVLVSPVGLRWVDARVVVLTGLSWLARNAFQDFSWLAEQLAQVPPAIRYRMDPKDCVRDPLTPSYSHRMAGRVRVLNEIRYLCAGRLISPSTPSTTTTSF